MSPIRKHNHATSALLIFLNEIGFLSRVGFRFFFTKDQIHGGQIKEINYLLLGRKDWITVNMQLIPNQVYLKLNNMGWCWNAATCIPTSNIP